MDTLQNPTAEQVRDAQEFHRKYFDSPHKKGKSWDNQIKHSHLKDANKLGQLFCDCFAHHHGIRYAPNDQDTIHFQQTDPKRLVRIDNLTSFFQKRMLTSGRKEFRIPELFETPNEFETKEEYGDPCSFEDFANFVTAIPFNGADTQIHQIGQNRISYLVGEIGAGKTFAISLLIQHIQAIEKDHFGYTMIPIRICMEAFWTSIRKSLHKEESELDDLVNSGPSFVEQLIKWIHNAVVKSCSDIIPEKFSAYLHARNSASISLQNPCMDLVHLSNWLIREQKTRLVIMLDNLDVLHYISSRYMFFDDHYETHRRVVEDILVKVVLAFVEPSLLGECGFCVLIAARNNVARDSGLINHGAHPRRDEFSQHSVFRLWDSDAIDVVQSRLALLEEVLVSYSGSPHANNAKLDFKDKLDLLQVNTTKSLDLKNLSDGLRRISDLSHHGSRSLVQFLGNLRLNILGQRDVVERLFGSSPWLLERLYISNLHYRYTQAQKHFPNLFLVDALVSEKIKKTIHPHTYWLKYLLLRRIGKAEGNGIAVRVLISEFVGRYKYSESLFRLAMGSLNMVNASRCIEFADVLGDDVADNRVRLTTRGKVLIGASNRYIQPYCFELSYLQMMVDDHLLSYPRHCADKIKVETNIGYALDPDESYIPRMNRDLPRKLIATLTFLRVLEAAWNSECKLRPSLASSAKEIGPVFDNIYTGVVNTMAAVIEKARITDIDVHASLETLRGDSSYDSAFDAYHNEYRNIWR
jgi:hypothetical protein